MSETAARTPGRPRSAEADLAIVRAALELLVADGYRALTMEKVRERSGVGKATLYRRYGSKEELVRAVVEHLHQDLRGARRHRQPRGRLRGGRPARPLANAQSTRFATFMPRVLAEVAHIPELQAIFYDALVQPRRDTLEAILRRAIERGEIRADVDVELAIDAIAGPMIYKVIITGGDLRADRRDAGARARARDGRAQASLTCTRPPSPTASVRRPPSSSSSSAPTSSRRQPAQRAHVGLAAAAADADDDRREVRAGGDQLVGEPGLLRAAAHERLGERDHRPVDATRSACGRRRRGGSARASRPRAIASMQRRPAAADDVRVQAADLGQLAPAGRLALGDLDDRRVAQDRADRAVLLRGGALAPGGELARDRAVARVEAVDAREPPPDLVGIALVGGLGDRAALLARPPEPAALVEPPCRRVGEREQVLDVAARVARAAPRSAAARPSA